MKVIMKRLIILLVTAFFMNASAKNIKDNYSYTDRCADLGYPLDKVIKLEKTIQKALKANDVSLFADQFNYPLSINLSNKKRRIISNKQELIDSFSLIYSKEDIDRMIAEKNLFPFCRYDRTAIFGGMWLSTDQNKNIKIFVINTGKNKKLSDDTSYGVPIMPVDNLEVLKRFSEKYNNGDKGTKIKGVELLRIESKWNDTYKPNLVSGSPFAPDYNVRAFLLYQADINNDGQSEWVLVYPCEGSMCTSGIAGVYQSKDQQLQAIHFDEVIASNFNLDMSKWYLYLDASSFSQQKGKILMNFYNSRPTQVCSYLWQNNKVILVHGNQSYCIH
jgi:hypothetical protein